jgi:uncharacterized membrane protein
MEQLVSVWIPLVVSIYVLWNTKFEKIFEHFPVWMYCSILSFLTISWDGVDSLFILPIYSLGVVLWVYTFKDKLNPLKVFTGTFSSVFVVDCLAAWQQIGSSFWSGIGGAGFQDALFVYPVVTMVLVWWMNVRSCNSACAG